MPLTSKALRNELNELKTAFAPLAQRLHAADDEFRRSGVPIPENLVNELVEFKKGLADIGVKVRALGLEMGIALELPVSTLDELRRSIEIIAEIEKQRGVAATRSAAQEVFQKRAGGASSQTASGRVAVASDPPGGAVAATAVSGPTAHQDESDTDEEIAAILANLDRMASQAKQVEMPAAAAQGVPAPASPRFPVRQPAAPKSQPAPAGTTLGLSGPSPETPAVEHENATPGANAHAEALCDRLLVSQEKKTSKHLWIGAGCAAALLVASGAYMLSRMLAATPAPPVTTTVIAAPSLDAFSSATQSAASQQPAAPASSGASATSPAPQAQAPAQAAAPVMTAPETETRQQQSTPPAAALRTPAPQPIAPAVRLASKPAELPKLAASTASQPAPRREAPEPPKALAAAIPAAGSPQIAVPAMSAPLAVPPPPSAAEDSVPVRIGAPAANAKLISAPKPIYPVQALKARVQGTVRLEAVIGRNGSVETVSILSGNPLLTQAAVDAVKKWRYQPTVLNGRPVEVVTTVDVNFALSNGQ